MRGDFVLIEVQRAAGDCQISFVAAAFELALQQVMHLVVFGDHQHARFQYRVESVDNARPNLAGDVPRAG